MCEWALVSVLEVSARMHWPRFLWGVSGMIIAHMVVGPGEADRYLDPVLARVSEVADVIHVALDPFATPYEKNVALIWADSVTHTETPGFLEHEGKFRTRAWMDMEQTVGPEVGDTILLIDADEFIFDPEAVKKAGREYPNQRLGFTFYHMWGDDSYRIDGAWAPHMAWILIPYRKGGRHADKKMACGREPLYARNETQVGVSVSDILHYGYYDDADKTEKYVRYSTHDGGRYHSGAHIKSIIQPPSLERWEKGGMLNVGSTHG